MPKRLLQLSEGLVWRHTAIRPADDGIETELGLLVEGRPYAVAFSGMPDPEFLAASAHPTRVGIEEIPPVPGPDPMAGRFRIILNDIAPNPGATLIADQVRWGWVGPSE